MDKRGKELWIDFAVVKEQGTFAPLLERFGIAVVGRPPQVRAHCPFHDDREPSLQINYDKRVFHCFGCGASGNLLDFVARLEKVGVREAAAIIAEACGLSPAPEREKRHTPAKAQNRAVERRKGKTGRSASPEASVRNSEPPGASGEVEREAADQVNDARADAEPLNPPLTFTLKLDAAHPYLKRVAEATVEKFGLGYCGKGLMKGRVCVPLHNERGDLVGYLGRWVGESELPAGEGKYKLPPKLVKRRLLFNLHRVREMERLVIVEGVWSIFRLDELGVPAVALLGHDLHPEQVELLRGLPKLQTVVLLLDGDQAGRQGADQAVSLLARQFLTRIVDLPEGQQPDTVSPDVIERLRHP